MDSLDIPNLDKVYEFNLTEYHLHLVSDVIETSEIIEDAEYIITCSGISLPNFNGVVQSDFDESETEVLDKPIAQFKEKELPFTWWVGPTTSPNNLDQILKDKGLRYLGDNVLLGVELENMIRNISSPNSLYIDEVDTEEKLKTWVDIYCRTNNIKGDTIEDYFQILNNNNSKTKKWIKYLGWLNGQPVATSTLILGGGIAAVYDESVLPKYRGWGIEDSMNIIPLRKSKQQGYKIGFVNTSVGGIKRFTKLEFQEMFRFKKFVFLPNMSQRRGRKRRRRG